MLQEAGYDVRPRLPAGLLACYLQLRCMATAAAAMRAATATPAAGSGRAAAMQLLCVHRLPAAAGLQGTLRCPCSCCTRLRATDVPASAPPSGRRWIPLATSTPSWSARWASW